ncbi:MAG: hypothetical protein ACPIOQ_74235, partial [Promethearchaeia archaeon]
MKPSAADTAPCDNSPEDGFGLSECDTEDAFGLAAGFASVIFEVGSVGFCCICCICSGCWLAVATAVVNAVAKAVSRDREQWESSEESRAARPRQHGPYMRCGLGLVRPQLRTVRCPSWVTIGRSARERGG